MQRFAFLAAPLLAFLLGASPAQSEQIRSQAEVADAADTAWSAQAFGRRPAMRPAARPRPGMNRPIGRPRPGMTRPSPGYRPPRPGFNRPAVGARPPISMVRPDGSSVVIRPPGGGRPLPPGLRPPPVRPPFVRPPGFRPHWRPWRRGLAWAFITAPVSYAVAEELRWCHVHRYRAAGLKFHSDVRCHFHRNWSHGSLRYVYGR